MGKAWERVGLVGPLHITSTQITAEPVMFDVEMSGFSASCHQNPEAAHHIPAVYLSTLTIQCRTSQGFNRLAILADRQSRDVKFSLYILSSSTRSDEAA